MKYLVIGSLLLQLFIEPSNALSPDFYYMAINEEEKKCSEYLPGNDFRKFILPEGWVDIGVELDLMTTTCRSADTRNFHKNCCQLLGYQYVDVMDPDQKVELNILSHKFIVEEDGITDNVSSFIYMTFFADYGRPPVILRFVTISIVIIVTLLVVLILKWSRKKKGSLSRNNKVHQ